MLRDGFGVCARAPCRAGWSLRLHAGVTRRRRVAELASACRASRRWCGLRMCGRRRVLSRMPPAGTYAIRRFVTEAHVVPGGLPDSFREGGPVSRRCSLCHPGGPGSAAPDSK
jgi:hypothetical protein